MSSSPPESNSVLYLDQAAALRPEPETLNRYQQLLERVWFNQEAGYHGAFLLRQELDQAGRDLARAAGLPGFQVLFGSSGTELASTLGTLPLPPGGNLVTTELEHPALAAALTELGRECRRVGIGPDGRLRPEELAAKLDADTRLVACHWIQSELGVIQDWSALAELVRRRAPRAWLVCDAIQGAGKLPLPTAVDLLLLSGHKFGVPGGAALLHRPELRLERYFHELRHRYYRLGRPEPALILLLAEVFIQRTRELEVQLVLRTRRTRDLRARLTGLPLRCTIPEPVASPYILHVNCPGRQGRVLVRMLGERGVCVGSGSACQAEEKGGSPALRALGFRGEAAYSGLRLSFGFTPEEPERIVRELSRALAEY